MSSQKILLFLIRILQGLGLVGFSVFLLAFVEHSSLHISYPWATDYVEMPEIGRAYDLSRGTMIYSSWLEAPFLESNYTPLYSLLNACFVAFTGPTPFSGRLISFVCVLLTAATLRSILVLLGGSRVLAALAGLFVQQVP